MACRNLSMTLALFSSQGLSSLCRVKSYHRSCGFTLLQLINKKFIVHRFNRSYGHQSFSPLNYRRFGLSSSLFHRERISISDVRNVGRRFYCSQQASEPKQRVVLGQVIASKEEDQTREGPGTESGPTSKDSKSKSSSEKALKWTKISFGVMSSMMVGFSIYLVVLWGPPDRDDEGNIVKDEFSEKPLLVGYVLRAASKLQMEVDATRAPSRPKLLPDPLQEPYYQPPYTLVVEMTDVLVHPEYDWSTGWRFKKRPGVDMFIQQVGPPLFELVIYTQEGGHTAWPILDSLDPNGFIMYRLFRDATKYEKGKHYKDLHYLNRDLSKVIAIDWDREAVSLNPDNAFVIKRWTGDNSDRQLIQLADFLRTLATSGLDDVRPALQHYSGEEDPLERFKENQRRLQEEQAAKLAEHSKTPPLSGSWMSGMFGRRR